MCLDCSREEVHPARNQLARCSTCTDRELASRHPEVVQLRQMRSELHALAAKWSTDDSDTLRAAAVAVSQIAAR